MARKRACECGCGKPTPLAPQTFRARGWIRGKPIRFLPGHNLRIHGLQYNQNGPLNPQWKGDTASYSALHKWLQKNATKTGVCQECDARPLKKDGRIGTQWANVSGLYKRDVKDYMELCCSCHRRYDLAKRLNRMTMKEVCVG